MTRKQAPTREYSRFFTVMMLTEKLPSLSLLSPDLVPVDKILENAHHWRRLALRLAQRDRQSRNSSLLYGGLAAGVLAGTVLSLYLWKRGARASDLQEETPGERVEDLISSCEHKIEDLEKAIFALQAGK